MGANFEIETVSRQFIPLDVAKSLFHCLVFDFAASSITCIDDWEWSNQKILPIDGTNIMQLISEGRIVFLEGTIAESGAGIVFSKEDDVFHTELWFEVSLKPELKHGLIDERENFYRTMEEYLESFSSYGPICTAMGEEMYFCYCTTEKETLERSLVDCLIWNSISE